MTTEPEYKFDLAEPDEYAFIFDSWARSFQKSPWAGPIPNHLYPSVSRAASTEIVDRGAKVLVAYVDLPGGGRRVMGYSVSEPEKCVLHWLFMKLDYRRKQTGLDIAQRLLAETVKDWPTDRRWFYTYRTRASASFLGSRFTHDKKYACVKG